MTPDDDPGMELPRCPKCRTRVQVYRHGEIRAANHNVNGGYCYGSTQPVVWVNFADFVLEGMDR